ncbi:DUF4402 domain-containing protein [Gramella jeungdoensis]|uniref:DUF4402 domain-containing protein n=1 Tax=Gramella jeungdoensis TaxID=708091 RepID=A0ABT0Z4T1_9FLAO|nr:DUF4402 domain-containing protein [Gramella jeungdoensis]MCM8570147.1 DUF4402 domain-containing protein [Gramella jeungdoensis]
MFNSLRFFIPACLFFLISFSGISQRSATASFTATVTIIDPIEIQATSDMNFASIDARNGGTVTLNPDNTRSSSGDVLLDNTSGVSAATFEIKGQSGYSFDLCLPEGDFVLVNGPENITIKDFTSDLKTQTLLAGTQMIRLGATLEIAPNQRPGVYSSPAPIEVTVNYN